MKKIRLLLFSALGGVFLLASCGDKLHETDHPDKGKLKIITDWGSGVEATIPYIIKYSLEGSDVTETVEGRSLTYTTGVLTPGKYNLEIYSKDFDTGFTLDGDVIEVDADTTDEDFIVSDPAVFFSARTSTEVRKDRVNVTTVPLYPQMRKLVIRVYLANDPLIYTWGSQSGDFRKIDESTLTGTLTGASNRFDFIADSYSGDKKLNLTFRERKTSDNKQRFLESVVTVVGFNEDPNVPKDFTLAFKFADGVQIPATTAEFHSQLFEDGKNFNDYEQKRINDTVSKEIVLPLSSSGVAYIRDYEPGNGENGEDITVSEDIYKYTIGEAYPKNEPEKEGIVIWLDTNGSHGIVLSGRQSEKLAWGPTGEIYVLNSGGDGPEYDADNYRQYTTISTSGKNNTDNIRTYIENNKVYGSTGYLEQDFEAYAWIRGSESDFSGYWFLPSAKELELISDAETINGYLRAAGFPEINETLWSSQTQFNLTPEEDWFMGMPTYDKSDVLIRLPDGTIGQHPAVYDNPDYDPLWTYDPNFPEITQNPNPEFLPYKFCTRAYRFF